VGGLFFLSHIITYLSSKLKLDLFGGPPIPGFFAFLPGYTGMTVLPRDHLDVLAGALIAFLAMVAWESLEERREKWAILLSWFIGLATSWFFIGDYQTFLTNQEYHFFGWSFTRFETGPILQCIFLGILIVHAFRKKMLTGDIFPVISGKMALKTGFIRWILSAILFFFSLQLIQRVYAAETEVQYYVTETWALLFQVYILLGLPYAILTNLFLHGFAGNRQDTGFMLFLLCRRGYESLSGKGVRRFWNGLTHRYSTLIMRDLLVKLFFGPIMIMFLFQAWRTFSRSAILPFLRGEEDFSLGDYHLLFMVAFALTDLCLGLIGYLCASRWLKNKTISVENTWGGWFSAVVCYPPLFYLFKDFFLFGLPRFVDVPWTDPLAAQIRIPLFQPFFAHLAPVLKVLEIFFFGIYLWATTAFGLRFSNLTHRGIIDVGPYAYVRHPAYMAKAASWWCAFSLEKSAAATLMLICLSGIYFYRGVTEERHLSQDPKYVDYCQKVKYRYIPGIY
jgi:hypothetical protein